MGQTPLLQHHCSQSGHIRPYLAVHGCSSDESHTAQTRSSERTPLLTALLEGPAGAGKTAIAATLGIDSGFPYVKVVSADNMVGWGETAKASQIAKVFDDAYKVRDAAVHATLGCWHACRMGQVPCLPHHAHDAWDPAALCSHWVTAAVL